MIINLLRKKIQNACYILIWVIIKMNTKRYFFCVYLASVDKQIKI